jgi:4-hydroxybenzoyl-CoA thioesterase
VFIYERAVRFEEVDAAQILFFSRFLNYCHEAMEALLSPLEGGYVRLITKRRLGLPAVHVEMDFSAPLRFGDVARIAVTVERIGRSSFSFRYEFTRGEDATPIAKITHICALTNLETMRAAPIPEDLRRVLSVHLTEP